MRYNSVPVRYGCIYRADKINFNLFAINQAFFNVNYTAGAERTQILRVTGPPLRRKAEDVAKKWVTEGWFHRWMKCENISSVKPHGEHGEADHAASRSWAIHSE